MCGERVWWWSVQSALFVSRATHNEIIEDQEVEMHILIYAHYPKVSRGNRTRTRCDH